MSQPQSSRRWAILQAGSGLLFSLFVALHLVNTALAARGAAAYNEFQRALRPVYQFPPVEVLVILAPLVVHIVAGVIRMRERKGQRAPSSARLRAHRYAGYFLLLFIFGHIAATRTGALLRGVYPEFEGVAYTFEAVPYFFYPYYPALALAGLLHAAIGIPTALGVLGIKTPPALRRGPGFWLPVAIGALAVMLGVAALGGLLHPLPDQSAHPFAVLVRGFVARLTGIELGS